MSILPASLDYSDRDFASIRLRMFALIASVFPNWSDQNVANFGNILLELFAFTGDILTFNQNNAARESRLITASQRKNILALADMLNYTVAGTSAAYTTETITLAAVPTNDVTLPAGTIVSTATITSPVPFQLLVDTTIAAGTNPPTTTAVVENSASFTDIFTSTGLPNQAFALSGFPYLDMGAAPPAIVQTTTCSASNGTFSQVENFLDSGPTDLNFVVSIDQGGIGTIKFGNGVNGAAPTVGSVTVNYRAGGGLAGNVDANSINQLQGYFTDVVGNPVQITVTNLASAQGGLDAESNAHVQYAAPRQFRATTRSVANEDFVIHAEAVPGVARAFFATSNQQPGIAENTGIVYVVPVGGGIANPALLAAVLAEVTVVYPCTTTFQASSLTAAYFQINVFLRAYKTKNFTSSQLGFNARASLATYFAISLPDGTPNPTIDFGANILDANGVPSPIFSLDLLLAYVQQAQGIRLIDGSPSGFTLNGAHVDLTVPAIAFPVLGTVTIIDADTGFAC